METQYHHVLLAIDADGDRKTHSYHLKRRGLRVSEAADGVECLGKSPELRPDLILLDLAQSRMGNWETNSCLKQDDRTKHIPVIIMSSHPNFSAALMGCESMLKKPCLPEELFAEIRRILGSQEQKPAAEKHHPTSQEIFAALHHGAEKLPAD